MHCRETVVKWGHAISSRETVAKWGHAISSRETVAKWGHAISSRETCLRWSVAAAACAGHKSTMRTFPSADLAGYHLELLLVARQPEEEVLLFSVYAGLAVHRAIMLRIYLIILLVLLTSHTVPTCMKSGTQLTFLNCMTG